VDAALARVAASSLRLHAGDGLERLRLGKHELAAVEVLRSRPLRPAEVARSTGLEERTAQLLTYLLLLTRQVDVVPAPAAAPSAPPAGAQPSAELASRRREILERAAAIDSQDYFDMLGLARDATTEQVEAAYFEAAKRWHPDRLPPELASVRDACTRIFARIGEARVTLADESARARYLKVAADGSGSPQAQEAVARVVEAATQFQKAEVCFKRNDLAQAETFCRRAHELDPTQPDYLALLAWLVATKVPDKAQSCIAMLDRAVAMSDRCEKAFFWRGMLHKRLGRVEQAMRDFERAAEINPRNIDALREVRLHQMRGGARGSKKG
jgi:tetratricopeptide (TPR) repeat protein